MSENQSLKICIIGAGVAGISVASSLRDRGYTQVTVLEKTDRIGGQCHTIIEDGVPLDIGAIFVLPDYRLLKRLVSQTGASLHKADHLIHLALDGSTRPFGKTAAPYPLGKRAAEFLRIGLQFIKYPSFLQYGGGLGDLSPAQSRDLALPYKDWIKKHHLDYFHQVAYPLMRSWGFGYEEQNIPALYILRTLPVFARYGNLLELWDLSKVDFFRLENGYGNLWKRVASRLNVRLGVHIQQIKRHENGGVIHTNSGPVEFDRLVLACPLNKALGFLDVSPEEQELFSKIQSFEVWQMAARVDGLGEAVFFDRYQSFLTLGHAMSYVRYQPSANWYYFFGYTGSLSDEQIQRMWEENMQRLGGRIIGKPIFSRWSYFPHYNSAEVAGGYHVRLEKLQGKQATYYAGEIMSLFGVDPVASYAENLVKKFF